MSFVFVVYLSFYNIYWTKNLFRDEYAAWIAFSDNNLILSSWHKDSFFIQGVGVGGFILATGQT